MQAMARGQDAGEAARAYPPTLLEWTASRDRVNMALDVYCFNGELREAAEWVGNRWADEKSPSLGPGALLEKHPPQEEGRPKAEWQGN